MRKILMLILVTLIVLTVVWIFGMMIWARQVPRPTTLGVQQGQLSPCPDSPNCVTTQVGLDSQKMPPLSYQGSLADAKAHLKDVIAQMPRTELVEEQEDYLSYVFRTRLMSFPDDVEFTFDDTAKQIHFRSASRIGKGDMGVNRARMEAISQAFGAKGGQ